MGLYKNGQMIMYPIYGQISYNCCISNALKWKVGHPQKIFLVEMERATETQIAQHLIRPAKAIPASRIQSSLAQLLIIMHTLWKVLKRVEERWEMRMVGKRLILVLL